MRPEAIADTGALLALLDRDDRWHAACVEAFGQLRLPLLTSTAVLTELFHLVGDAPRDVATTWRLVRSGALDIGVIGAEDLPDLEELMKRYSDRPMDFADATLVHLAGREGLTTVFTVDHDDFETYRLGARKRFSVLPARGVRGGASRGTHSTRRQKSSSK